MIDVGSVIDTTYDDCIQYYEWADVTGYRCVKKKIVGTVCWESSSIEASSQQNPIFQ